MQQKAIDKRKRAADLRRVAETSQTASDRAFFKRQAQQLEHQARDLERQILQVANGERLG